jgi:hypothetical protein
MKAMRVGKKGKDFILGHFYIILNMEVGKNIYSPFSVAFGQGRSWENSCIHLC